MRRSLAALAGFFSAGCLILPQPAASQAVSPGLPRPDGWILAESREYVPENLFEYIDGAAENYLSYDFIRLTLGQYKARDGSGETTAEIYDMGAPENAFGIYASERAPGSTFIDAGVQGYIEEGVLNFFADRFYVKLLTYDAGDRTEGVLRAFAAGITKGIPESGGFPAAVRAFPAEGRVADSEKYIRRDFLGLAFLSRGYTAVYRPDGSGAFDLFIIDAVDEATAHLTLERMTAHFAAAVSSPDSAVRFKDPFLGNVVVAVAGRHLCGAMKLEDNMKKRGESLVLEMVGTLGGY